MEGKKRKGRPYLSLTKESRPKNDKDLHEKKETSNIKKEKD